VTIRFAAIALFVFAGPLRVLTQTSARQQTRDKVTLTYFEKHFIVRDATGSESAPLKLPPEEARLSTVFRRNATFAVWDERGLTIRVGQRVKSFRLGDVATSPKAFTRDEIIDSLEAIRNGDRTREASALSGAARIGNDAYFLARWDDRAGSPWAEAIVRVDLSLRSPEPRFAARAPVLSLATKPIDDQVFILDGRVTYIARKGDHWGLEQLDPGKNRLTFDELGDQLLSYLPERAGIGLFVERTSYGTTVAGRVDLKTRARKTLAESRMNMRFADGSEPVCLVLSTPKSAELLDTASGAMMDLPPSCSLRRMEHGILIWTPADDPKKAWLYDPARWEGKAWWNGDLSKQR